MMMMNPVFKELIAAAASVGVRHVLQKAAREFQDFHWGNKPRRVKRVPVPTPEALVQIGELVGVIYRTSKGGDREEDWIHHFEDDLPLLAYDAETRDLLILGGDYDVEPEGIVG